MTLLTDADRDVVRTQLTIDEGYRGKPYRDTVGKLTIGIGRNLDDVGITRAEADYLLGNDIATAEAGLLNAYPWVAGLDGVRQQVLVNMALNMGMATLSTFKATLAAVEAGDWSGAAAGMRASKWAGQVGARAQRLAKMMETGQGPGAQTADDSAKALQSALNRLGASPKLKVDGNAGRLTAQAVQRFQSANGLQPTGLADTDTWAKIRDHLEALDA